MSKSDREQQSELEEKLAEFKRKVVQTEIALTQLKIKRALAQAFQPCRLCKQLILNDYPFKCCFRNCTGGICETCSMEFVCERCKGTFCDECCVMFDQYYDGDTQLRCLHCADRG